MGTPFSNANEYTMRAFVVVSSILAACRAEASLPLAAGYGYAGVAPYATHGAIAAAHATYGVAPAYAHAAYAAPVVAHAAPVVAHAAPVVAKAAPVVAAAPVVKAVAAPAVPSVTSTQYRAGDEFGNNAFGYSNINSPDRSQETRPESPEATPMLMSPEFTPDTMLLMPTVSVSLETTCPLPPLLLTEDAGPLLLPSTLSPMLLLDMLLPLFPMELSEMLP